MKRKSYYSYRSFIHTEQKMYSSMSKTIIIGGSRFMFEGYMPGN